MKKVFSLLFLFLFVNAYSQTNDVAAYFGCYANNDTINLNTIKQSTRVNILGNGATNARVSNWDLVIQVKNGKSYTFNSNTGLITKQMKEELIKNYKKTEKILVQNISYSAFNKKTKKYEDSKLPGINLYLNDRAYKQCDEKNSQAKDDLRLRFSCFKTGDSATIKDVLRQPTFTITNLNPKVDIRIVSYNFLVPKMDARRNSQAVESIANTSFALNDQSFELAKKLVAGESFVLDDIIVEFSNKKTKNKETVEVDPIIITIAYRSSVQCGEKGSDTTLVLEYSGKLLTGKDKNQPLTNQAVLLKDARDTVIQTTKTNSYGDFTFRNLNSNESYRINIPVDEKTKIKDQQLYLAKVDGTIVKSLEKNGNKFVYEVLPTELTVLAQEKEEDTELKIKNFGTSNQVELTVIENIYYAPNSFEINDLSISALDKIINAMQKNKALKLAISSHTDSKGEDAYNMALSEKRAKKVMEYFLSKGIEKERLTAKGYGETQIKNRCKNGVDCSELEHELNRRTEFKFTK